MRKFSNLSLLHLKQIIAILLFLFVFSFSFKDILTIVHFYHAQAEISEKFCQNRDKPELQCKGKCYLAKKLKIQKDTPDAPLSKTNQVIEHIQIPIFVESIYEVSINWVAPLKSYLLNRTHLLYQSKFLDRIFHPPKPSSSSLSF